mmetsp:Transcript_19180/g.48291  ORF Transcript_19180/g.48291 Transcript_19180/m.48291 type:complete len:241 (+) Transcript_19180:752-1474(+)
MRRRGASAITPASPMLEQPCRSSAVRQLAPVRCVRPPAVSWSQKERFRDSRAVSAPSAGSASSVSCHTRERSRRCMLLARRPSAATPASVSCEHPSRLRLCSRGGRLAITSSLSEEHLARDSDVRGSCMTSSNVSLPSSDISSRFSEVSAGMRHRPARRPGPLSSQQPDRSRCLSAVSPARPTPRDRSSSWLMPASDSDVNCDSPRSAIAAPFSKKQARPRSSCRRAGRLHSAARPSAVT